MFRRSRFSVRPNISTTGRTSATPQDLPSSKQESTETCKDSNENITPAAVTETPSAATQSETSTVPRDGNYQTAESTSSSAAVQRRKRFAVKPKVAPGRPTTHGRTPKSPIKPVSEVSSVVLAKPSTSSQTGIVTAPQGLQSPKQQSASEESIKKHDTETSLQKTDPQTPSDKQLENSSECQVKDAPPRPPAKAAYSVPDREAVEISEKAKTLVSSKSAVSLAPSASSLSRLLNDPSDLQRIAKATKLRELLRVERQKDKISRKAKSRVKEFSLDPAKMTMSDLIHYLPRSNPMTSSLEATIPEDETVVPPSPAREEPPETAQEPEALPQVASPRGGAEEEQEDDEAAEDGEESLMVPQVKVAEDGTLIIDEESLTVEVLRAKGPNPAKDRDPIFERGSTTTYSSFRTVTCTKPWSSEETDMFYLAISMVGTDFCMICQLFPHRARTEIKNKFKKEERVNTWRIDKAFRERRKLDIEYFTKLLDKILEFQKNKKKLKSLVKKNATKNSTSKTRGKRANKKLSNVGEENGENRVDEVSNLEEEQGEKENEDLCNEGETSKPKRRGKRKTKEADSTDEPDNNKKKRRAKSTDQAEAGTPEDPEAVLPENDTSPDMSENTENANPSKDTLVKPAKLSRSRVPKPLLPLGRKWGKKPPPSAKASDNTAENENDDVHDGSSAQVNKDLSPSRPGIKESPDADVSSTSENEEAAVQTLRPTRYGRMPKPIKPLVYPAKENVPSSASDAALGSLVASTASSAKPKSKRKSSKQGSTQQSKKPKLVTLRASQSEDSEDGEDEPQQERKEMDEEDVDSRDGSASVFVPACLRSPHPVIPEVEETMEELDILANIPNVLGISQDAMCPNVSWEKGHSEMSTAEPHEHQLDLLVDVIDYLSAERVEACQDESYNEAAHTLLTIGNATYLPPGEQNQSDAQDCSSEMLSDSSKQPGHHMEQNTSINENSDELLILGRGDKQTSENIAPVAQQHNTTDSGNTLRIKTCDQVCDASETICETDPTPISQSSPESSKINSPQSRKGRFKFKPKPNIGRVSATALPQSNSDRTAEQKPEESCAEAVNDKLSEEENPNVTESSSTSLIDLIEQLSEEQSGSQGECLSQSSSEIVSQSFYESLFDPSTEEIKHLSTFEPYNEKGTSPTEMIADFSNNSVLSETGVEQQSDTDYVQMFGQQSACFVTPVDLPAGQKEDGQDTSTSRLSGLQKIKPKPNIPQTSRTVRSTLCTTKQPGEKESKPTEQFDVQEKTTEVEAEAAHCTSSEKQSLSSSLSPVLIMLSDSVSVPAKDLPASDDKKSIADGLLGQVSSVGATSSLSGSQDNVHHQRSPEAKNSGKGSKFATTTAATEMHAEQELTPTQEKSEQPPTCGTSAQDLPFARKEDIEVKSPLQSRRSRLPKFKPNIPQTSRTARSKQQIEKDSVESNTTQILKDPEKVTGSQPEEECRASTKVCKNSGDALSLIKDVSPTVEEKRTDVEPVDQVHSIATTLGHSSQSDVPFEPIKQKVEITSAIIDEAEAGEENSEQSATQGTGVEDGLDAQKGEIEVKSPLHSRRSQVAKVKPKPNIPQTSRTPRPKPLTEKDSGLTEIEPEKRTDIERVDQVYNVPAILGQSGPSDVAFEPNNQDAGKTSAVTDKESIQDQISENCNSLVMSDVALTKSETGENSSEHAASLATPVSQKEATDSSTPKFRKRLQKVKPKPHIPQTVRSARPVAEPTKEPAEKAPNSPAALKVQGKTSEEIEPEATDCTSSECPSQSTSPSVLISEFAPTREQSTTEQKKMSHDGFVAQVSPGAETSGQSGYENHVHSEAHFEPSNTDIRSTFSTTDERESSQKESSESSDGLLRLISTTIESQDDNQNINDQPVFATQKAESEVQSCLPPKRSRLQKVKPKPNIPQTSRTAHSTRQNKKDSAEKESSTIPVLKVQTIVGIEPGGNCGPSSEEVTIQSSDSNSAFLPTKETKSSDIVLDAATSDHSSSGNHVPSDAPFVPDNRAAGSLSDELVTRVRALPESQPEQDVTLIQELHPVTLSPSKEHSEQYRMDNSLVGQVHFTAATSSYSTSENDKEPTHDGKSSSINELVASVSGLTDSQAAEERGASPVLPVSQKEENKVASCLHSRRSLKVKPKPNIPRTLRTARLAPQTTKDSVENSSPTSTKCEKYVALATTQMLIAGVDDVTSVQERSDDPTIKASVDSSRPDTASSTRNFVELLPTQLEEGLRCLTSQSISNDSTATEEEDMPTSRTPTILLPPVESCTSQICTEETLSTVKHQTESGQNLVSGSSEPNLSPIRRQFSKVKPNLVLSTRTTQTEQPEKQPTGNAEKEQKSNDKYQHLNTSHNSMTDFDKISGQINDDTSSGGISAVIPHVADNPSLMMDSVIESKSSEVSIFEDAAENQISNDAGSASKRDLKLEMSTKCTDTNSSQPDDPTAALDLQSLKMDPTETKTNLDLAAHVPSAPDSDKSSAHPCLLKDTDGRSGDAAETRDTNQTSSDTFQSTQSGTDGTQHDLSDSSTSPKKAPQTRRGRLIKPKPNLGRSSRPLQPRGQDTKQEIADSGASSGVSASVHHGLVSELQTDVGEPVEGAPKSPSHACPPPDIVSLLGCFTQSIDQQSENDPTANDDVLSLRHATQVLDFPAQTTPTSTTGENTQCFSDHPSLLDMTSVQVPSDPDEPFFILSLTEIPVESLGQVINTPMETHLYGGDALAQQQSSSSAESLTQATEGSLSNDATSQSTEQSSAVTEPDPLSSGVMEFVENPVNPPESTTTAQPTKLSETGDIEHQAEIPPTKQRSGAGRRAPLQVKATTTRKTRASKTSPANVNQNTDLGPPMQPQSSVARDDLTEVRKGAERADTAEEVTAGGSGPDVGSSRAQMETEKPRTRTRANTGKRSCTVLSGDPSTSAQIKTSSRQKKHSTTTRPAASAAQSVEEESNSTPSTVSPSVEEDIQPSQNEVCSPEVLPSKQRTESSVTDEEHSTVSEYFFSDIFTPVEED